MAGRVAVVGTAQTKYEASKPKLCYDELIWEVVGKVLQETGLKYEDEIMAKLLPNIGYRYEEQITTEQRRAGLFIDKVISSNEDWWRGRAISDMYLQPALGCVALDSSKVSADAIQSVYHAVVSILSGHFSVVLVVGVNKESETVRSMIENASFDPIYQGPLGIDYLIAAALQAKRYMYQYGISQEQCAKVVVKNRRNAKNNPYAQEPLELTVADVLSSPMVAYPLRLLDCRPASSDGACAVILASEEKAKKITDKPIWIKGIGNCYDAHYLGDRDLANCDSLVMAAKRAYGMAGITDPRQDIDVAEISAEYSYQELLWTEGLGFCPRGGGGRLIDEGVTEMNGKLPVNPSGGVLSGNPTEVAGIARVAEATLQLRGEASARQVAGAKTALAHGMVGGCGQVHSVIILSR